MTPLQTELAKPAYTGLSDAAAAAVLNTQLMTGTQLAALGDVKLLLYQDATPSAMLRIKMAAATPDSSLPGLQEAAAEADAYLNDPHMEHIDFSNARSAGHVGNARQRRHPPANPGQPSYRTGQRHHDTGQTTWIADRQRLAGQFGEERSQYSVLSTKH